MLHEVENEGLVSEHVPVPGGRWHKPISVPNENRSDNHNESGLVILATSHTSFEIRCFLLTPSPALIAPIWSQTQTNRSSHGITSPDFMQLPYSRTAVQPSRPNSWYTPFQIDQFDPVGPTLCTLSTLSRKGRATRCSQTNSPSLGHLAGAGKTCPDLSSSPHVVDTDLIFHVTKPDRKLNELQECVCALRIIQRRATNTKWCGKCRQQAYECCAESMCCESDAMAMVSFCENKSCETSVEKNQWRSVYRAASATYACAAATAACDAVGLYEGMPPRRLGTLANCLPLAWPRPDDGEDGSWILAEGARPASATAS